jgi:hypothetical protein
MQTLSDYLKTNGKIKPIPSFNILKEQQKIQQEIVTPLPRFNCCCCQDKGTINRHIAKQFMELIAGYSIIPCTRCDVAKNSGLLELTPYQVPVEICEILHQQNKKAWDEFTVEDAKKATVRINEYIQKFNTF